MHKFIGAATRRTAGMAAGVMLAGGLVGGVLLAPGTAYAAVTTTATTISATAQGSTINVSVSVAPGGASGSVAVTGAGAGCTASVGGGMFGFGGGGHCQIPNVTPATYTLVGTYTPSAAAAANYSGSTSLPTQVTVTGPPTTPPPSGNGPVFSSDAPPTSVTGQSYSYQFQASNSPSYQLVGAPSWLSISDNGMVSGYIPDGTTSFTYSVYAWNSWGHVTAGPFNVFCGHNYQNYGYVDIHTNLWCTRYVFTGQRGYCTLTVTNWGRSFAPDVTAQIVLPWQLKAGYTGYFFGYGIYGNTVSENLGTLYPGQTKELFVTFTARTGFNLWGWHPGQQFTVRVVGSASSSGNYGNLWFYGQRQSYSVAYVTIIPRGHWW